MRVNLTSAKVAAIGEIYKKTSDPMAIMDLLLCVECENRIAKSIKRMQKRLEKTIIYTQYPASKVQATPRNIDDLRDF